jgi:hypothetical protein
MTQEPEIFSSQTPHEVHLAEGSHTAIHKTANPMEPLVHQTEVNPDEAEEFIEIAQGVSVSKLPEAVNFSEDSPTAQPDDMHHATEAEVDPNLPPPAPLEMLMSDLPSLDLNQGQDVDEPPGLMASDAPEVISAVTETPPIDNPPVEPAAQLNMEEMNFPARVVKLKIANDKIRDQIETLEKPLFAPIVESVPAAKAKGKDKGKGKEETAKPSKGH